MTLPANEYVEKSSKYGYLLGAQVFAVESLDYGSRLIEKPHKITFGVCVISLKTRDAMDRPICHEIR